MSWSERLMKSSFVRGWKESRAFRSDEAGAGGIR